MKSALLLCIVSCCTATSVSASTKNIVQLAQSVPDLSTLVTALTAGELTTTLSSKGPFTVFAPTNEAFGKLPAATLAHLLDPKNIKELQAILEYHVISGAAVFAKDLKTFQMVKTVEGDEVKIVKAGSRVIVNNATVTAADNAASNGVVHIIDGVLIPPTKPTPAPTPAPMNIVQLAQSVPDLSTLVTALVAGKLTTTLSGAGPFTVFAPTNEAFAKIPAATLAHLLDPKNIKELQRVLTLHVILGQASPGAAPAQNRAITQNTIAAGGPGRGFVGVSGDTLFVVNDPDSRDTPRKKYRPTLRINPSGAYYTNWGSFDAIVTSADNIATNGVVHIIDNVLIPPAHDLRLYAMTKYVPGVAIRCGDVNAGPRIPAAMFDPSNAAVLKEYVDITIKLYSNTTGVGTLALGECKDIGYDGFPFVNGLSAWAPPLLMDGICAERCHCSFTCIQDPRGPISPSGNPCPPKLTNTTLTALPACKDQPDNPKAGKWCSLCGPKFNQPITVVQHKKQ